MNPGSRSIFKKHNKNERIEIRITIGQRYLLWIRSHSEKGSKWCCLELCIKSGGQTSQQLRGPPNASSPYRRATKLGVCYGANSPCWQPTECLLVIPTSDVFVVVEREFTQDLHA